MSDAIDELQEKWENALRIAAKNQTAINGIEGTKNTATAGGEVQYSLSLMNDETDEQKAERLRNASMNVTIASEESIKAASEVDAKNISATEAKRVLEAIIKKFGVAGKYSNKILEIEFDYSNTAIHRSFSHQSAVTGRDFSGQALVQANIGSIAENAYPVEAHADEKPTSEQNRLSQAITLAGAMQAGPDAVFVKMTVKIPVNENNRLHMVVTSEIKKGLDLTFTTGATESHPAGKTNPTITLQQYFENVKDLPEFTKRIPVDLVLQNGQNSAVLSSAALDTDEAYLAVAEKYRDGTATEAIDKLQQKWETALRVAAENQIKLNGIEGIKNTATDGGEMQYSIATSLKDDLQSVFDNKFDSESSEVLIGETSDFLVNEIGVKPLPNYMPANKAYSAMATEEKAISDGKPIGEKYHYHGLGVNGLFDLLEKSENPVAAYADEPSEQDGRFDRLVLVTDKEINGGLGVVVVEVDSTARHGKKQVEANKTITSYDKQSAIVAVQKAFDENRLLYVNKKAEQLSTLGGRGLIPQRP